VGWAPSDASGDLASRVGRLISTWIHTTWINTTTAAEIVATPNLHQSRLTDIYMGGILLHW
ncbi:MAG: hypothetical protein K7J47_24685, partial [Acidobacteria bacterium]|nr:hypothetical protein [Bryobacteraceae bacterium CoA2 C42]